MHIKNKIDRLLVLTEALPLSVAKYFSRNSIPEARFTKIYDEAFGGKNKYRVYIKLDTVLKAADKDIPIHGTIRQVLIHLGYEVVNYKDGIARKKGSTQVVKIGKVLSDKNLSSIGYSELGCKSVRNMFLNDPNRQAARVAKHNTLFAVISRHAYDIAGMSTGRGWTSCMELSRPRIYQAPHTHFAHLKREIEGGTLVAYLIKANDKNINNPLGRLTIKAFMNDAGELVLVPSDVCLGTVVGEFRDAIVKWLNDNINSRASTGNYRANTNLELSLFNNIIYKHRQN
jgi:hypothetical protein